MNFLKKLSFIQFFVALAGNLHGAQLPKADYLLRISSQRLVKTKKTWTIEAVNPSQKDEKMTAESSRQQLGYVDLHCFGREGWIEELEVDKNHRKKGVGSALFKKACTILVEADCTSIGWRAEPSLLAPDITTEMLVAFYIKNGATLNGVFRLKGTLINADMSIDVEQFRKKSKAQSLTTDISIKAEQSQGFCQQMSELIFSVFKLR